MPLRLLVLQPLPSGDGLDRGYNKPGFLLCSDHTVDPNVLINVVSRRVKQLRRGSRPLVESLEKLSPEDIALREVIEGKISYELHTA